MTRLAVLGGGSWGTTFAQVLADSGAQVTLWARREEVAREIREEHRNRTYLGGHRLPAEVTATSSVAEAVDGADGIVVALPVPSLRPTDRKSTRLNSSHVAISYAVFCLKKK